MNQFAKFSVAVFTALTMGAPVLAQESAILGVWAPDKDSDYTISMCGAKGDRYCMEVTALRGGMRKPDYLQYEGKYLVENAKAAGNGRFKGKINYFGVTGEVTATLTDPNTLRLKACAYFVVCKEITLKRKS